jgi:cyclomaltodextrin glucanotransferase
LVVINKGPATRITVPHTGLPDGDHPCRLTGITIALRDGGLHDLELPAQAAHLLSLEGERVRGTVVCVFQLNGYTTQPGESVAITGSCPELGGWDHNQAYGLEYVNANTWIGEVPFERCSGERIHYKFLVRRAGAEAVLENLTARRFVLPEAGRVKFDCVWGQL